MADPNDMTPEELLRSYMGPSATTGPEAAAACLICGRPLKDYEISHASTCVTCEVQARHMTEAQEAQRADKVRGAYFSGLREDAPELHREIALSKHNNLILAEQLRQAKRAQAQAAMKQKAAEISLGQRRVNALGMEIPGHYFRLGAAFLLGIGVGVAIYDSIRKRS